ncbi:hypothetical protein BJV78DRAFT_1156397 [Lactifluus subvellereus]|nr:hypothetical protein BJV78DRAFT_1156397 [Lactifluus subvellereus]
MAKSLLSAGPPLSPCASGGAGGAEQPFDGAEAGGTINFRLSRLYILHYTTVRECVGSAFNANPQPITHHHPTNNLFLTVTQLLPTASAIQMASNQAADPSISNFTSIFETAAKEYKKLTKKDLHNHPFAAQFDRCDSPGAVLGVFQNQAQAFDQLRNGDERLMKWLSPTQHLGKVSGW